jgi:hypothetical protein
MTFIVIVVAAFVLAVLTQRRRCYVVPTRTIIVEIEIRRKEIWERK